MVRLKNFKARLVAKVYSQKEGLDNSEIFSSEVKILTLRSIISLVASKNYFVFQIDVYNAFLNCDLLKEVYM